MGDETATKTTNTCHLDERRKYQLERVHSACQTTFMLKYLKYHSSFALREYRGLASKELTKFNNRISYEEVEMTFSHLVVDCACSRSYNAQCPITRLVPTRILLDAFTRDLQKQNHLVRNELWNVRRRMS